MVGWGFWVCFFVLGCFCLFFVAVVDVVLWFLFVCLFACIFVFQVPTFTRRGHECRDLLSPCNGMYASTNQTSIHTIMGNGCGW